MATRATYRNDLKSKLLALEDGGYGDFEYEDSDLNFFLSLAVSQLYPAVYKRVTQAALALTKYGTQGHSSCTPLFPDRVFLVEDAAERTPIGGWRISGTDIVNIDTNMGVGGVVASVNVYYHDAYSLNDTDTDDVGISAVYSPLINLGALIEALEARQDTGVRGDPPPTGPNQQVALIDRLTARYERLVGKHAMGLPGMAF